MTDRNYFAANCPESFLDSILGSSRMLMTVKKAMKNRGLICGRDFNDPAWHPTQEERMYLECVIRFEYADMMIKAAG